MTPALKKIANDLIKLPPKERIELADRLYASVMEESDDAEFDKAWETEIDRRLDEYEKGKAVLIPSAELHAYLRTVIRETRRSSKARK